MGVNSWDSSEAFEIVGCLNIVNINFFCLSIRIDNFGGFDQRARRQMPPKSTSSNSGQNGFSLYQRVPNNFLGSLGVV